MMRFFRRFDCLDEDYLHTDKHIHSNWSDGDCSIRNIAEHYKEAGAKRIAITDHIRKGSAYFSEYYKEIKKVSKEEGIEILVGFEAKITDFNGNIDVSESVEKNSDIKIASVHRFPIGRRLYKPEVFKKSICQEIELELSIAAIKNPRFNVLGHPGGMSLKVYNEFPLIFFEKIIVECKKNDIAFDLNSAYHLPIIKDLMRPLEKHNPYISFGSDLHKANDFNRKVNLFIKHIFNE